MRTGRELDRQTPAWLSRLEDPWGITWRLSNLARRFSAPRTARFAAACLRQQRFDRPIFILGAPRSGTTMVFRWLAAAPGFGSLPREGHDLWRAYHHPRYGGWRSDVVGPGEIRWGERRFAGAFLRSYFPESRFVEKTPENSFRVPYLLDLFPNARFLVVRRDPPATIRSLIRAWRDPDGRFRSYFVPERLTIPEYPHPHRWCFALIEGWRELRSATIPEIAVAQWTAFARALAAARKSYGAGRWLEIRLEDLLEKPDDVSRQVYEFAEMEPDAQMTSKLTEVIENPVYALNPQSTEDEFQSSVPGIADLIESSGYRLQNVAGRWVASPSATPFRACSGR